MFCFHSIVYLEICLFIDSKFRHYSLNRMTKVVYQCYQVNGNIGTLYSFTSSDYQTNGGNVGFVFGLLQSRSHFLKIIWIAKVPKFGSTKIAQFLLFQLIQAIQVLRFHLLELEKVRFVANYVNIVIVSNAANFSVFSCIKARENR